ncbi:MAG: hypothetical protein ACW96U_13895 [Candidatus Heimdallarchaeaceae archaeon]|jgi:DNA-binding MarR family transcriptional regulator
MSVKQKTSMAKKILIRRHNFLFLLYLLSIAILIIFLILEAIPFAIITGILLSVAILSRIAIVVLDRRLKKHPEKKTTDWRELRQQLSQILVESKILLDTAVELKDGEISTIILSEEQVNGNFFEENEELIKTIRDVGIEGLLCLMFLIQQQPAVASVRAMQRSLKIPLASAYRHLQKLSDYQLVITYYLTEKPSKVLYKITDEGSSLIIRFYELIGGSIIPTFDEKQTSIEVET